ncbi:YeeE/YedE family protein [Aliiroseovarius sp. KMU-50]|uniref:YeeE/YedE family protein n=1 Tax=Aliiroseovarius salicola TaxID=3009082 RepID=A0ABT4W414_9RHOB|nr:YeeE/YedE family protein [Aliiroseovarius sp. KMU-50]MDA5094547.1 YeeE/YedE family protein [Aliiroseovarius sp. KMU-50]
MFDWVSDTNLAALIGLIGGVLLGLSARLGRFCTLGAIEDALYGASRDRLAMWGVAIGVAMIGCFSLVGAGLLPAEETVYLSLSWNPLASIIGGLIFGYGMALSGNCGFGALARLGGGDLRSFVIVLVMGLSAYTAISGPFARLRVWAFPETPIDGDTLPSIAHGVSGLSGLSPALIGIAVGVFLLSALLIWSDIRIARAKLFWGAVAGLAVVIGWGGTAWVATNGFSAIPVESHTYSAPIGDTLIYLMTSSGNELNFGVGSVAGVLLGALLGSVRLGHFRWEACEDPRELKRQILGAVIMGWGAVIAFGCSIGQGLSAFALLYYGAPVTFLAIIAGAALGLRHLISGFSVIE